MGKFKNLLNETFGQITIKEQLEDHYTSGGNKKHMWRGECSCGRCDNVVGTTCDFTSGRIWRCTYCVREETSKRMHDLNKKYNKYDLSGEYGIGWTSKGEEFYFDLEDYDKIKDYCWYKHHKYFVAKGNNHQEIYLHKLVMDDLMNEFDIDHIKTENKFDNRKFNLRKVNRSQNNSNKIMKKNNNSGIVGVHWHSRDNVWEAWIRKNKKDIYLGRFDPDKFEDAVKARKAAEEKYFGEYSYDNSQSLYEENLKLINNKGE